MPSRTVLEPAHQSCYARRVSRFVLTCEHASHRLPDPTPPDRGLRELLRSHWGWDIGAWALTRELARRLGAPAIGGRWSRLLIDLNRLVSEPSLIRREAGGLVLPWNRDLTRAEIERRVLQVHAGYHNALDRLILRQLVRETCPAVIAIHTFTPEEFDGRSRRFDAGVLFRNRRRVAQRVGAALREGGLAIRYNEPYSGLAGMMYSADRHGTHHGLDFLELEFNQKLFDQPRSLARLARVTAAALREVPRRVTARCV